MVWWQRVQRKTIISIIMVLVAVLFSGCSVEQDPAKAAEFYAQGVAAAERGELDTAISQLRKATKYDEKNVEYTVELANHLIKKGKYEETENLVLKAIKHNSSNIELRLVAGANYIAWLQSITNYLDMGALADKGIKQFNFILEREPDHFDALLYRANTYANYPDIGGIQKQAEEDYKHLLKLEEASPDPKFAQVYYYFGEFYLINKEDAAKAKALWQQGFERYPNNQMLKEKLN